VEVPASGPRDLGVESFLGEGVAEGAGAGGALLQQPDLDQLGDSVGGRQLGGEAEVELPAEHGGCLGRFATLGRDLADADEDGLADRVGNGNFVPLDQLEPRAVGAQRAPRLQRDDELLDEEGGAEGAVVHRPGEGGGRRLGQQLSQQRLDPCLVERLQRQLFQQPGPAQLVPQPAQPVFPREAVGAVGAEGEDRHLPQRRGQRSQQLQRRVIRPLQVVEDDDGGPLSAEVREGAADSLEDRRPFALVGGFAELGQEQGEVGEERAAAGERIGVGAQPRPQGGDDRPVGDGGAVGCGAVEDDLGPVRGFLGEAALADPGLAGEEQERAVPFLRSLDTLTQAGELLRPSDQRRLRAHRQASLGATRGATLQTGG
jgi:hypothetical protein